MTQYCINCALYKNNNSQCPIFHDDMTEKEGCPYFANELNLCDICGGHIFGAFTFVEEDGQWKRMCQKCNTQVYNTCNACAKSVCRFRTDKTIRIPMMIPVQRRQGNMVIQTQQINPERVKATCMNGCPCWEEDGENSFCKLEACGTCANYQTKWMGRPINE